MAKDTLISKRKKTYRSAEKILKSDREVRNQFRKLNSTIPPRNRRAGLETEELRRMETVYSETINLLTDRMKQIENGLGGNIEIVKSRARENSNYLNDIEKKRIATFDYMFKLRKTLSKDLKTINACIRTDNHPTVSALYNNSRSEKLEYDLSKSKKYGGNLSTRFRIQNPEKNGFFTESKKSTVSADRLAEIYKDENLAKYGDSSIVRINSEMLDLLTSVILSNREMYIDMIGGHNDYFRLAYSANDKREFLDKLVAIVKQAAVPVKNSKGEMVSSIDEATSNRLCDILGAINTPEEYMSLIEHLHNKASISNQYGINEEVGINSASKADKRNSAMTMIAGLMGCDNIVAKSISLHVKDTSTGKIMNGTFMENAVGVDKNSTKMEEMEKLNQLTPDKMENCLSLKKDIANLQILDWICGNPDRHLGNLFYKFDDNGNLVGIMGIDNDTSFGKTNHAIRMKGTYLENMSVIPEDTANRILAMDNESLKTMLYGYDLSSAEVDNAIKRFNQLKTKITKDADYFKDKPSGYIEGGRIRVVSDQELDTISLFGHLGRGNIANKVIKKKGKEIIVTQGRQEKNLFASICKMGVSAHGLNNSMRVLTDELMDGCGDLIRENFNMEKRALQMDRVEAATYKGSQLFRDMINSLKNSSTAIKNQQDILMKVDEKGIVTLSNNKIVKMMEELQKSLAACNDYLDTKNEAKIMKKSHSSNAYKRFKLAKDAKTALEKNIKFLGGMVEKANQINGYAGRRIEIGNASKAQKNSIVKKADEAYSEKKRIVMEINSKAAPDNQPVLQH